MTSLRFGLVLPLCLAALLAVGAASPAAASTIYNESINGDAPNSLPGFSLGTLALGTSTVIGTLPGGLDDDWFNFTIGSGKQLDAILTTSFVGAGGNASFSPGGSFNVPWNAGNIGQNILALTGPTLTLGPGNYSVKVGTGTNQNTYSFDFVVSVTAVPEPTTLLLLGTGLAAAAAWRRLSKRA